MKVTLREVAHARTGEKGDIVNLSVIAYREDDYALIEKQVTVASVRELYGPITKGEIRRYEVPGIGALNFVIHVRYFTSNSPRYGNSETPEHLYSIINSANLAIRRAASAGLTPILLLMLHNAVVLACSMVSQRKAPSGERPYVIYADRLLVPVPGRSPIRCTTSWTPRIPPMW